jgi:hypothetical protein
MLISNRYTRILEITATSILPTKGLFLIGTICTGQSRNTNDRPTPQIE